MCRQLLKQLPFIDPFMGGYNEGVFEVDATSYLILIISWEDITRVCKQLLVYLPFVDHFLGGYDKGVHAVDCYDRHPYHA